MFEANGCTPSPGTVVLPLSSPPLVDIFEAIAVTAMASKMAGKGGLLNGKTTVPGDGVQPFASNTEMVTAMRDPRYRKDPAYRKGVENRLRVSPAF